MRNFWNEGNQVRLPFVQKFNEAVKGSEEVVGVLGSLVLGWCSAGLLWYFDVGAGRMNAVYFAVVGALALARGFIGD